MPRDVVFSAFAHHTSGVINNNCRVPKDVPVIFILSKFYSNCIIKFVPDLTFLKIKLTFKNQLNFGPQGIGTDRKIS